MPQNNPNELMDIFQNNNLAKQNTTPEPAKPSALASAIGNAATAPLQVLAAPVRGVANLVDKSIKDDTESTLLGGINKVSKTVASALTPKALSSAGERAVVGAADTIDSLATSKQARKAGFNAFEAGSIKSGAKTAANVQLQKEYKAKAKEADQKVAEIRAKDISGNLLGEGYKAFRNQSVQNREKLSAAGKFISDLGYSAGRMAPDIVASVATSNALGAVKAVDDLATTVTSAAGLATMFNNVYSDTYYENRQAGYDIDKSAKNATAKAAIEVGTEILGGGLALTEMGGITEAGLSKAGDVLANIGAKITSDADAKVIGHAVVGLGKLMSNDLFQQLVGEGTEEWLSEFLSPYADRLTIDPNAALSTPEERAQAFLGGALMGFGLEAPRVFIKSVIDGGNKIRMRKAAAGGATLVVEDATGSPVKEMRVSEEAIKATTTGEVSSEPTTKKTATDADLRAAKSTLSEDVAIIREIKSAGENVDIAGIATKYGVEPTVVEKFASWIANEATKTETAETSAESTETYSMAFNDAKAAFESGSSAYDVLEKTVTAVGGIDEATRIVESALNASTPAQAKPSVVESVFTPKQESTAATVSAENVFEEAAGRVSANMSAPNVSAENAETIHSACVLLNQMLLDGAKALGFSDSKNPLVKLIKDNTGLDTTKGLLPVGVTVEPIVYHEGMTWNDLNDWVQNKYKAAREANSKENGNKSNAKHNRTAYEDFKASLKAAGFEDAPSDYEGLHGESAVDQFESAFLKGSALKTYGEDIVAKYIKANADVQRAGSLRVNENGVVRMMSVDQWANRQLESNGDNRTFDELSYKERLPFITAFNTEISNRAKENTYADIKTLRDRLKAYGLSVSLASSESNVFGNKTSAFDLLKADLVTKCKALGYNDDIAGKMASTIAATMRAFTLPQMPNTIFLNDVSSRVVFDENLLAVVIPHEMIEQAELRNQSLDLSNHVAEIADVVGIDYNKIRERVEGAYPFLKGDDKAINKEVNARILGSVLSSTDFMKELAAADADILNGFANYLENGIEGKPTDDRLTIATRQLIANMSAVMNGYEPYQPTNIVEASKAEAVIESAPVIREVVEDTISSINAGHAGETSVGSTLPNITINIGTINVGSTGQSVSTEDALNGLRSAITAGLPTMMDDIFAPKPAANTTEQAKTAEDIAPKEAPKAEKPSLTIESDSIGKLSAKEQEELKNDIKAFKDSAVEVIVSNGELSLESKFVAAESTAMAIEERYGLEDGALSDTFRTITQIALDESGAYEQEAERIQEEEAATAEDVSPAEDTTTEEVDAEEEIPVKVSGNDVVQSLIDSYKNVMEFNEDGESVAEGIEERDGVLPYHIWTDFANPNTGIPLIDSLDMRYDLAGNYVETTLDGIKGEAEREEARAALKKLGFHSVYYMSVVDDATKYVDDIGEERVGRDDSAIVVGDSPKNRNRNYTKQWRTRIGTDSIAFWKKYMGADIREKVAKIDFSNPESNPGYTEKTRTGRNNEQSKTEMAEADVRNFMLNYDVSEIRSPKFSQDFKDTTNSVPFPGIPGATIKRDTNFYTGRSTGDYLVVTSDIGTIPLYYRNVLSGIGFRAMADGTMYQKYDGDVSKSVWNTVLEIAESALKKRNTGVFNTLPQEFIKPSYDRYYKKYDMKIASDGHLYMYVETHDSTMSLNGKPVTSTSATIHVGTNSEWVDSDAREHRHEYKFSDKEKAMLAAMGFSYEKETGTFSAPYSNEAVLQLVADAEHELLITPNMPEAVSIEQFRGANEDYAAQQESKGRFDDVEFEAAFGTTAGGDRLPKGTKIGVYLLSYDEKARAGKSSPYTNENGQSLVVKIPTGKDQFRYALLPYSNEAYQSLKGTWTPKQKARKGAGNWRDMLNKGERAVSKSRTIKGEMSELGQKFVKAFPNLAGGKVMLAHEYGAKDGYIAIIPNQEFQDAVHAKNGKAILGRSSADGHPSFVQAFENAKWVPVRPAEGETTWHMEIQIPDTSSNRKIFSLPDPNTLSGAEMFREMADAAYVDRAAFEVDRNRIDNPVREMKVGSPAFRTLEEINLARVNAPDYMETVGDKIAAVMEMRDAENERIRMIAPDIYSLMTEGKMTPSDVAKFMKPMSATDVAAYAENAEKLDTVSKKKVSEIKGSDMFLYLSETNGRVYQVSLDDFMAQSGLNRSKAIAELKARHKAALKEIGSSANSATYNTAKDIESAQKAKASRESVLDEVIAPKESKPKKFIPGIDENSTPAERKAAIEAYRKAERERFKENQMASAKKEYAKRDAAAKQESEKVVTPKSYKPAANMNVDTEGRILTKEQAVFFSANAAGKDSDGKLIRLKFQSDLADVKPSTTKYGAGYEVFTGEPLIDSNVSEVYVTGNRRLDLDHRATQEENFQLDKAVKDILKSKNVNSAGLTYGAEDGDLPLWAKIRNAAAEIARVTGAGARTSGIERELINRLGFDVVEVEDTGFRHREALTAENLAKLSELAMERSEERGDNLNKIASFGYDTLSEIISEQTDDLGEAADIISEMLYGTPRYGKEMMKDAFGKNYSGGKRYVVFNSSQIIDANDVAPTGASALAVVDDSDLRARYEAALSQMNGIDDSKLTPDMGGELGSATSAKLEAQGEEFGYMYQSEDGSVNIPNGPEKGRRNSRFVRNVLTDERLTPEQRAAIEAGLAEGNYSYIPQTNKQTEDKAVRWLEKNFMHQTTDGQYRVDIDKAVTAFENLGQHGHLMTAEQIDQGIILYNTLIDKASATYDGVLDNEQFAQNIAYAERIIGELAHQGTGHGRAVQVMSALKKTTGIGRLYYAERAVEKLIEDLSSRDVKIPPELRGFLKGEEMDEIRRRFAEAKTPAEFEVVEQDLIDRLLPFIPPTFKSRVSAYRYLCMLGNPKTHIRNVASNAAMYLASRLSDYAEGALEDIFMSADKNEGKRKKSAKSRATAEQKAFAKKLWAVEKDSVTRGGGKIEFRDKLAEQKRSFGDSFMGKALESLSRMNSSALGGEDAFFEGVHYVNALAGWMAANNYTPEMFESASKRGDAVMMKKLAEGKAYAADTALKLTYNNANAVANMLNQLENRKGLGGDIATLLLEGIVPFKRTPMNVLLQGLAYSPVGGVKAIYDAAHGDTQGAIHYTSTSLTGTAIFGLGLYAAMLGKAKASGSDSDREEYYDQMVGNQEFSITVGDVNYTLDWLTPVSMPFFSGVVAAELLRDMADNGQLDEVESNNYGEALVNALAKMADPITNLSMLSGLNDALNSYSDNKLGAMASNAVQSYALQFVPTMSGQLIRTMEDSRKTTYAPKDSTNPFGKTGEQFVNKLKNKSLIAHTLLGENEDYVDMWGRTEDRSDNYAERAFEQFISPGYIRNVNTTEVDDRLAEIFEETHSSSILPATPSSYLTINKEKDYLSSKEYKTLKETVGQISYQGVDSAFASDLFDSLSADGKVKVISNIYSYAKEKAKDDYAVSKDIEYEVDGDLAKVEAAMATGLSIGEYYIIKYNLSQCKGTKNANGKTISGSVQKAKKAYARSIGLNKKQMDVFNL